MEKKSWRSRRVRRAQPLFGKNEILKILRKAKAGVSAYRKPGA